MQRNEYHGMQELFSICDLSSCRLQTQISLPYHCDIFALQTFHYTMPSQCSVSLFPLTRVLALSLIPLTFFSFTSLFLSFNTQLSLHLLYDHMWLFPNDQFLNYARLHHCALYPSNDHTVLTPPCLCAYDLLEEVSFASWPRTMPDMKYAQ